MPSTKETFFEYYSFWIAALGRLAIIHVKIMRYAAERLLLIIGEAANHLSPQFRNKHPEIPWPIFIQFRNILAHEYGESLLTRVWLAATKSVPELLESLEKLLTEE